MIPFIISVAIPTIVVIWVMYYAYTLEIKIEDTEDALSRSRWQLKSEKEYVDRLEKKVLELQPK